MVSIQVSTLFLILCCSNLSNVICLDCTTNYIQNDCYFDWYLSNTLICYATIGFNNNELQRVYNKNRHCDTCKYFKNTYFIRLMKLLIRSEMHSSIILQEKLHHLLLCNLEQDDLNLSEISHNFPFLVTLEVHNSNITTIDHNEAADGTLPFLQVLNVSHNELQRIMLPHLHALEKLDLRHNRFSDLRAYDLVNLPNLRSILLAGNPWECEQSMLWLLEPQKYSLSIQQINERMTCAGKKYNGKQVLGVLGMKKVLEATCPEMCTCSIDKVVGNLIPLITVDCSHKGLTEMPKTLPLNTTTLRLQNNKLIDVMPLVNNTDYLNVKDVYLDYNMIASIDVLEGSKWLESFRLLSLRGNYLTQLHTYSFNHAFQPNQQFDNIFLGKNPWKCDCSFTPAFRDLILKYESYVKDINDIRCAISENDETSNLLIVDLKTRTLCDERGFLTKLSYADYCSLLFATLTLLVISNLIVDWIRYRKSGKLPWIAKYLP